MIWSPSGGLALYDGCLWSIDGFFLVDVTDVDQAFSYLGFLNVLFKRLCWWPPY